MRKESFIQLADASGESVCRECPMHFSTRAAGDDLSSADHRNHDNAGYANYTYTCTVYTGRDSGNLAIGSIFDSENEEDQD